MWQEPIIKERIETAIREGITSQAVARTNLHGRKGHFMLHILASLFRRSRREEGFEVKSNSREVEDSFAPQGNFSR